MKSNNNAVQQKQLRFWGSIHKQSYDNLKAYLNIISSDNVRELGPRFNKYSNHTEYVLSSLI